LPVSAFRTGRESLASADRRWWQDREFSILMILAIAAMTVFNQFESSLSLYAREVYGLTENFIGLGFVINTLLIIAFEMFISQWLETKRKLFWAGVGFLLVCSGLGVLPMGRGLAVL